MAEHKCIIDGGICSWFDINESCWGCARDNDKHKDAHFRLSSHRGGKQRAHHEASDEETEQEEDENNV